MNKKIKLWFIFTFFFLLMFPIQLLGILTLNNSSNITKGESRSSLNLSEIYIEEENEFSEGTMDRLGIDENGNLEIESNSTSIWESLMNPSIKPSARDSHSMVYDVAHERIILFGGFTSGDFNDETWVYNLTDNSWTNMNPSTKPSARIEHSMVYDTAHERVILFGGSNSSGYNDETWVYNLTDNLWTNMNPLTKPSARDGHSMIYDVVHEKVILFGGGDDGDYDDETWIYNLTNNSWTNMNPLTKPSARDCSSMAYDSAHERVILFGGYTSGGFNDETWVYNLTDNSWTNMNPLTKPSARYGSSMVYDVAYDRVILFGGQDGDYDDETWIYNLTDNSWTNTNPSTKPSARDFHSMAYDAAHERVILFGGNDGTFDDETWIFSYCRYYEQGIFDSKLKSFDMIYKITGAISWIPIVQPLGTSLTVQIGFSLTTNETDFIYTALQNESFTFEGTCKYFKYRVNFESNSYQRATSLLNKTTISYTLEAIRSNNDGDDEDDDNGDTDSSSIPGFHLTILGLSVGLALISIAKTLNRKKITLYN